MSEKCPEPMLSIGEIAYALGVHRTTIHNYIKRGLLVPDFVLQPANGRSGRRLFKQRTVDKFIDSCIVGRYIYSERLYRSGELAKMFGCAPSTVNSYVDNGLLKPDIVLPATCEGKAGKRLFTKTTVQEFLSSRKG